MKLVKEDGPKAMTVGELHSQLGQMIPENKAHFTVDILTESRKNGQVQQELGGIRESASQKLVILVPNGF